MSLSANKNTGSRAAPQQTKHLPATGDSQVESKCEQNGKNSRFNGRRSPTLQSSVCDLQKNNCKIFFLVF